MPEQRDSHTAKHHKSRWRFRIKLWVIGLVAFILLWGGLARVVPGVPSPKEGFVAAVHSVHVFVDDVYNYFYENKLEKNARLIQDMAEEQIHTNDEDEACDSTRSNSGHHTTKTSLPIGRAGKLDLNNMVDSIMQAELRGLSLKPEVGGKVINIVVIGVDSRLGARGARADAIHLVTINPDSAIVDITSIPRGTYLDLGYDDSTRRNMITYARMRGMDRFLRAVEKVTGRAPVKYYVEAGFSQVMGILELLKYKDPVGTLQYLRARKSFYTGDVQRSFNQGMFIRQSLHDKFYMLTGATGELIVSTGLQFVHTNLTKDMCTGLVYALQKKGFPHHRVDAVRARILPKYKFRLKSLLPDSETIEMVEKWADRHGESSDRNHEQYIIARLRKINRLAAKDSARPGRIIWRLERVAEQHAWLQVQNKTTRYNIRDTLLGLLEYGYEKVGKSEEAQRVRDLKRAEDILWRANGLPGGAQTDAHAGSRDSIPQ